MVAPRIRRPVPDDERISEPAEQPQSERRTARQRAVADQHPTMMASSPVALVPDTAAGNSRFFRNLVVLYANGTDRAAEDVDDLDAPTIRELTEAGRVAFTKVIDDYDGAAGTAQQWTIEQLTDRLLADVFVDEHFEPDDDKDDEKVRGEQPQPYPAASDEHMATPERGEQRLAMGRFDARASAEDLLDNLEKLAELVVASRRSEPIELNIPLG